MDTFRSWIVTLGQAASAPPDLIGNKAANLARLAREGYRVPQGFCLTTAAYDRFIREGRLKPVIQMELQRKSMKALRWEELWDIALRIRSAFLAAEIDDNLSHAIQVAAARLSPEKSWAVRSSAPGEDSAHRSFAGLHESVVGVCGVAELLDAVRKVWASLWSDAALLYFHEMSLDPSLSSMAVIVQEMVEETPSGVAFARDPRDQCLPHAIIEAVPGRCGDLVDGSVDPDRWVIHRESEEIMEWCPGRREQATEIEPLLEDSAIHGLLQTVKSIEGFFGWAPDIEWTGHSEHLTILQARPITSGETDASDPRQWYLSLTLGGKAIQRLATLITETRIPQLLADGERLARESLDLLDNGRLADAINQRSSLLKHWKKIYLDEFIPFADGVRRLGLYYNDAVRPDDPYEFVGLLKGEPLLATRRNLKFKALANLLEQYPAVKAALEQQCKDLDAGELWASTRQLLAKLAGGAEFIRQFESLLTEDMDIVYGEERMGEHPELILATLLQLAQPFDSGEKPEESAQRQAEKTQELEIRLFDAVGEARQDEAAEFLRIGRLSWRLRDDDNLLVARLESQLLRALRIAVERLIGAGRLPSTALERIREDAAPILVNALRNPTAPCAELIIEKTPKEHQPLNSRESPRQLVGQPAAPGIASGPVCRVGNARDLGQFRQGCVLVCDAIQPMMTHLVPLATAIIERRGGMLIHGAIIARELRIPCVNGIDQVVDLLAEDEWVTVDGHLGIVTVGRAEFDLETRPAYEGARW